MLTEDSAKVLLKKYRASPDEEVTNAFERFVNAYDSHLSDATPPSDETRLYRYDAIRVALSDVWTEVRYKRAAVFYGNTYPREAIESDLQVINIAAYPDYLEIVAAERRKLEDKIKKRSVSYAPFQKSQIIKTEQC